jgi:hypothetical protein
MIKLDGLQFLSKLQALGKGVLLGLQNLVAEVVAKASEEQFILEELFHVLHSFQLGLIRSGASESNGGHGGSFAVGLALVGGLDPFVVVVDHLSRLLRQIREVGAGCTSPVLGLVRLRNSFLTTSQSLRSSSSSSRDSNQTIALSLRIINGSLHLQAASQVAISAALLILLIKWRAVIVSFSLPPKKSGI